MQVRKRSLCDHRQKGHAPRGCPAYQAVFRGVHRLPPGGKSADGPHVRRPSVQLAPRTPWAPATWLPDAGVRGLAFRGHVRGAGRPCRAGTQLADRIVGLGWRGGSVSTQSSQQQQQPRAASASGRHTALPEWVAAGGPIGSTRSWHVPTAGGTDMARSLRPVAKRAAAGCGSRVTVGQRRQGAAAGVLFAVPGSLWWTRRDGSVRLA
jgi:hypothetical protein